VWYFDESDVSRSEGARRLRLLCCVLFVVYAVFLEVTALAHGELSIVPVIIAAGAVPLAFNRLGRVTYYFVPVVLGLFAYSAAGQYVSRLKLGVHFMPQLRLEEYLTPGPIPTVWLQDHLYHGTTGALEVFCLTMYATHFVVPLAFGLGLAVTDRGKAFACVMFGILAASIIGEITFVLFPTAPPWLAGQEGYVDHVHHILKQTLSDLGMTKAAALVGDPTKYDVTAAVPSLHVAFPVICIVTAMRARLPRWVVATLILNLLGVVFAIVYTGEHYLVDAFAGALYGFVACLIVHRLVGTDGVSRKGVTVARATRAP
jgi:hypothetical protein